VRTKRSAAVSRQLLNHLPLLSPFASSPPAINVTITSYNYTIPEYELRQMKRRNAQTAGAGFKPNELKLAD